MRAKVYYFSPSPSDSTAFYRTSGVLQWINHPDFELIDVSSRIKWDWASLTGCTVFLMQRPFATEHVQLLKLIKSLNIKIIIDFDDDLANVDMYNPTYQQYLASRENVTECVKLADELWASTRSIADSYRHINTQIIPNAHNDYLFKVSEKRSYNAKTKRCIYRGGGSHQADINSVANELIKVINDNPNWEFQFLGDRFTYLELNCGYNYQIVQSLPMMEFFRYYYEQNANIAIFPLVDTAFNRGKSNISIMESLFVGSAFFGNKKLPEFNLPFISDINDLPEMLREYDLHERNNELGWEWVKDCRLLSNVNNLRINRILENI